jgi:antirestriction protein ArdC
MTTIDKEDVYGRVTNRILADLEKGVRPWMKPWCSDNTTERPRRTLTRTAGETLRG